MAFGLFLLELPKTTSPESFFDARNSRESTFSNGCMFSFFLFNSVECGLVRV